jgi:small ligand-binding sensory domain FIST
MYFVSAITTEPMLRDALHRLETQVGNRFANRSVDLAVVFLSSHYRGLAAQVQEGLQMMFQPAHLIGCSAEGVIDAQHELEQTPAIALMLATLPGVKITSFSLERLNWEMLLGMPDYFKDRIKAPDDTRLFLLFGDPFSAPMEQILESFNTCYPGVPVLGGMASAAMVVGQNALVLNNSVSPIGVVGVALSGNFDLDLIVSQGCRPIGEPYVVTKASQNVIYTLENQPALYRLQELVDGLGEEDQLLMQRGLLIGRAINPVQERLGRGDFLIRGVLAADRQNGAITIGGAIQAGEIIQFHVRDAVTAQEDLEMMLIPQAFRPRAGGALLFTCNGRGTRLYDFEDGDITTVQKTLGNVPVAGFFCAGEIGPVGDRNFIHGHTACLAIFRPAHLDAE